MDEVITLGNYCQIGGDLCTLGYMKQGTLTRGGGRETCSALTNARGGDRKRKRKREWCWGQWMTVRGCLEMTYVHGIVVNPG